MKLKFFDIFSKKAQISNFMEIRPVGAELLHADGQRDMIKLTDAFHNFANSPNNTASWWNNEMYETS